MKSEQQTGKHGEHLAAVALRAAGVEMVERIGTPVRLIPAVDGTFRVVYGDQVSGDMRGIMPGGRSVLVECKTILDRNLRWSDMRPHQPERLSEHARLGGISLLVWVSSVGVFVMRWPIRGFHAGMGMTLAEAGELSERWRDDD